jgi:phosphatidylserine decarboxylase
VPRGAEGIGIAQFQYDPDDAHGGFTSWNDFFTRRFRAGQRPVAAPDDDTIIVSACEAIVLIEADDPTIGLVAFVPIGMSEVSSCLPTVRVRTELAAAQRA